MPFTKEALSFGGIRGLLRMVGGRVEANAEWTDRVGAVLNDTNDEVQLCAKRAEFVGKWLGKTGNAATVMALMGVRP